MKNRDRYPVNPILIVDDEDSVAQGLSLVLRSSGMDNVITCADSRLVMQLLARQQVELLLLDLTMPYITGEQLIPLVHAEYPDIPIIVVTASEDLDTAVRCMITGASDYMIKTVEENRLISGVTRAIELRELKRENSVLKSKIITTDLDNPAVFSAILTQNQLMKSLFLYIESISGSREPVLISGETGTGKSLIAQAIHDAGLKEGPFVEVNVAGLDDSMFADTIFGHAKGAYTGANEARDGLASRASNGTLFLDEIGDLSINSQIKLLTLLDTGRYYPLGSDLEKRANARIVLATNRELDKLIHDKGFRKDLFYRLSSHEVKIPPLRDRKEDIPLLCNFFLEEASREMKKDRPSIPARLMAQLSTYPFPGNIRELRARIFDALSRTTGDSLALGPFEDMTGPSENRGMEDSLQAQLSFSTVLPTIKRATDLLVAEALSRSNGNQSLAAGFLGISHQALNKRIQRNRQ